MCAVAEEEGALVYRTPGGMQLRPTTLAPSPLQSRKPELKARYRSYFCAPQAHRLQKRRSERASQFVLTQVSS